MLFRSLQSPLPSPYPLTSNPSPLPMRLSIVIPAYNEEARIGRMLDAYLPYFEAKYPSDHELIVSVNGTTDRTEDVVRSRMASHPSLRILVDPAPIGCHL